MSNIQLPRADYSLKLAELQDFCLQYYYEGEPSEREARIFPPHVHEEVEIYVLLDGDVSFMVEDVLYEMETGDMILTKPNEIHNCILNSLSAHKHMCLWISGRSRFLMDPLISHDFGRNNLITASASRKSEILATLRKLIEASENGDELAQFSCGIELIRYVAENQSVERQSTLPDVLQKILAEMNAEFATINSLEEVCQRNFISHSTLCRLFKKHLHTTPGLYLESKRLAHSRILLGQGKSVTDACVESGFQDYSNYIRLFKKRFGVTPNKFKQ